LIRTPNGNLAVLSRAIPDSRFAGFSGMGHDLPRALWPEFVRESRRSPRSANSTAVPVNETANRPKERDQMRIR